MQDPMQDRDDLEAAPEPDYLKTVNGAWRGVDGTFLQLPTRRFYADGRQKPFSTARRDKLAQRIARLIPLATSGSPTRALMAVATLRRLTDELEHEVIALARSYRWSWRDIGSVLGRSRSAVHERFARVRVQPRKRRRQS